MESPLQKQIPDFPPLERWLREYSVLSLSADRHVMEFFRPQLPKAVLTSDEVSRRKAGQVQVAGMVIRPHRPPTKSGRTVVFLTLEDEFGLIDVTIFENTYKRYGEVLFNSPLLLITGEISERDPNQITNIVASRITSIVS